MDLEAMEKQYRETFLEMAALRSARNRPLPYVGLEPLFFDSFAGRSPNPKLLQWCAQIMLDDPDMKKYGFEAARDDVGRYLFMCGSERLEDYVEFMMFTLWAWRD